MVYFVAGFASLVFTLIAATSTRMGLRMCALLGAGVPALGLIALLEKTASGLWLLASLVIIAVTGTGAVAGVYLAARMRS